MEKNHIKRKLIILRHNGGQFANQMWNFISIYAYGLEIDASCRNYSFFEYNRFFDIPVESVFFRIFFSGYNITLFFLPEKWVKALWRLRYKIISGLMARAHRQCVVFSGNAFADDGPYSLPPTKENKKTLPDCSTIYFDGWLFRNPEGLKKYRKEILAHFTPKEAVQKNVKTYIEPLREKNVLLVGVHIRQSDYIEFKGGKYFISQERVREIIDEYIAQSGKNKKEMCFVMCSDGKIQEECFADLMFVCVNRSPIETFFILAQCDIILGSNSTFGALASWFGNTAHIIFEKEKIDWEYYKDRKNYFENKYFVGTARETTSS